MRRATRRITSGLGLALAVTAASAQEASRPDADPLGAHTVTGTPGEVVPRFSLRGLDGAEHTLEQHLRRGQVVVLEWIAPTSEAWRDLHASTGPLRELRARHGERVAWLAICPFAVEEAAAGEPAAVRDPSPLSARQIQQQDAFWGTADGQRPSWDRGRGGQGATWPWWDQPSPVRFEGPTASLSRDEVLPLCREASAVLGPDVPVLLDANGSLSGRMGVPRAPHLVLVDRDGRLVRSISLAPDEQDELERTLRRLTLEPSAPPASQRRER